MKEAAGEANMTVVTIVLIAIVLGAGTLIVTNIVNGMKNNKSLECTNEGGLWSNGDCLYECGDGTYAVECGDSCDGCEDDPGDDPGNYECGENEVDIDGGCEPIEDMCESDGWWDEETGRCVGPDYCYGTWHDDDNWCEENPEDDCWDCDDSGYCYSAC